MRYLATIAEAVYALPGCKHPVAFIRIKAWSGQQQPGLRMFFCEAGESLKRIAYIFNRPQPGCHEKHELLRRQIPRAASVFARAAFVVRHVNCLGNYVHPVGTIRKTRSHAFCRLGVKNNQRPGSRERPPRFRLHIRIIIRARHGHDPGAGAEYAALLQPGMRLQGMQAVNQIRREIVKLCRRIRCGAKKTHAVAATSQPVKEALNRQAVAAAHGQGIGADKGDLHVLLNTCFKVGATSGRE